MTEFTQSLSEGVSRVVMHGQHGATAHTRTVAEDFNDLIVQCETGFREVKRVNCVTTRTMADVLAKAAVGGDRRRELAKT